MTCATRRRSTRAARREHAADPGGRQQFAGLGTGRAGRRRRPHRAVRQPGRGRHHAVLRQHRDARERLSIPLFVLVRPRPGDFHYDALETELMLRDIAQCRALGCDGVVIGALDVQGGIDLALCRELVQAAGPLQVTFHRAFDAARDLPAALEQVIGLGCQRVLTSGGQVSAEAGVDMLAGLVTQAAGRITVMAGAGLGPANIATVARRSGCTELHASAKACAARRCSSRTRRCAVWTRTGARPAPRPWPHCVRHWTADRRAGVGSLRRRAPTRQRWGQIPSAKGSDPCRNRPQARGGQNRFARDCRDRVTSSCAGLSMMSRNPLIVRRRGAVNGIPRSLLHRRMPGVVQLCFSLDRSTGEVPYRS